MMVNHSTIHTHYNIFMLCRRHHKKCRYHYIYDYFIIQKAEFYYRARGKERNVKIYTRKTSLLLHQPPVLAFQCSSTTPSLCAREYRKRGEKNLLCNRNQQREVKIFLYWGSLSTSFEL